MTTLYRKLHEPHEQQPRDTPRARTDAEPSVRAPTVLLLFALGAPLFGCGESATAKIEVALRNAPRSDSNIVTRIPEGSAVKLSKCSDGWCQVSWNGQQGYAFAKNFVIGGPQTRADADEDKEDFNGADD